MSRMTSLVRASFRYRMRPTYYFYSLGKIWLDPAYPAVVKALQGSLNPLLDIGCGMGVLSSYLWENGHQSAMLGLDLDAKKISLARRALDENGIRFLAGDATDLPEHQGDVVMLDVLHYLDDKMQLRLLRQVAERVAPGGQALIRVGLNEPNWRFALTRFEEWFVSVTGWISWRGSNFPQKEEVLNAFSEEEFVREVQPMWGYTPFNSYLFSFRRRD